MRPTCIDCLWRKGANCHHPQAEHDWSRLLGLRNFMTEGAYVQWPVAEKACGFFKPNAVWVEAADKLAQPKPKKKAA